MPLNWPRDRHALQPYLFFFFPPCPGRFAGCGTLTFSGASLAVAFGPGSMLGPPSAVMVAVKLSNGSTLTSPALRLCGLRKKRLQPSVAAADHDLCTGGRPATALQVIAAVVPWRTIRSLARPPGPERSWRGVVADRQFAHNRAFAVQQVGV